MSRPPSAITSSRLAVVERVGAACVVALATLLSYQLLAGLFGFSDPHDATSSFGGGFFHPVLGYDHLVAMVSVGLVSVMLGGDAIIKIPLVFVCCLLFGGTLGFNGFAVSGVEQMIAISICALGVLISFDINPGILVTSVAIASFGLVHGNAHGLELPTGSSGVWFAIGFCIASTISHLAGVSIGVGLRHVRAPEATVRTVGLMIVLAGAYFLVG